MNPTDKETYLFVMEIERFAIHDGPGIRTVVFLQGCPLRCAWCSNPESHTIHPRLLHLAHKCTGCGCCARTCPADCITMQNGMPTFDRNRCRACRACAESCLQEAIRFTGEKMSVSDIMNVIIRDREYYISSGGGLTFSGGEAFTQFDGLMKLLLRARQEDIPVAIETSGQVLQENLRRAYPLIHLFLFDMKHPDKYLLKKYTGADYDTILSNLTWIAEQNPAKVIARIPIIPGFNYDMHTIRELFLLLSERRIRQVHLLPYHTLGENKYRQLGLSCLYPSHRMLTKEDLLPLKDMGEGIGLRIWIGG